MTNPIDKAQLRALAEAATQGDGQHVYTNPRDDNNWRANEQWHRAASPVTIIALLDEVEALDTENDLLRQHAAKQINDATLLTGINIGNGSMDIGMQGGAAQLLAESFYDQFIEAGAVNYLEVRFDSQEKMPGKSMVVTLQLVDGLTPAQKIAELKAEVEALRADAARKTEQLDALLAHCGEGECPTCSEIICPHRDTLHFHHDGCPTCTQQEQAMKEKTP